MGTCRPACFSLLLFLLLIQVAQAVFASTDNCTAWGCTCQGFANYFGTYSGRGFGCGKPHSSWWIGHHCNADANCPCCKGPACALPGAAPCICPDGPNPPPHPPHPPSPPPPPAVFCPTPLQPEHLCSTCRGPTFSWDTLPVFMHVSSEKDLAFGAAQLEVLTKFPIVTIEKWQGCHNSDYTYEETAMLAAAKSIKDAAKAKGKHISVVVWFDSFRIYANTTLNPDSKAAAAGIACMNSHAAHFLESSPAHLLKDAQGHPVLESFAHLHVVDYTVPAMRKYKRDMCLNMTKSGHVDGCGIDGSHQRAGTHAIPLASAAAAARWNEGKVCMMNGTTNAIGDGLVLGKMPWELGGARGYANGIIQEGCTNSNATVTNLRAVAQRSTALGRPLVYECHANCNPAAAAANCASSIAAFLIGAGPGAYWGFGGWASASGNFSQRWVPEFNRPLGEPHADAVYDPDTGVWSRSFSSGTNVTFNALTNDGTITWGGVRG